MKPCFTELVLIWLSTGQFIGLQILFLFMNVSLQNVMCIQRIVITLLVAAADEDRSLKDVTTLLNVIALLTQQLKVDFRAMGDIENWLLRICKEQAIG